MSIVDFPNNSQRYLELGEEALAAGNQLKALHYFQDSYQLEPSLSLNYLIVNLLLEVGEAKFALQLTNDWHEDYLKNAEYLTVYIQLLLQNHRFLEARKLLKQSKILSEADQKLLVQQLNEIESYVQNYEKSKIQDILRQLEEIHKLSSVEQVHLIQHMNKLPFMNYCAAAKKLLFEERLTYLTRTKIVEELVRLGVNETFEMSWFDGETKAFIPAALALPENDRSYLAVKKVLIEKLEHEDPVALAAILEEVRLHFAILYPFASDYVTDAELWGQSYLEDYQISDNEFEEASAEFTEVQRRKEKLKNFLLLLMSNTNF